MVVMIIILRSILFIVSDFISFVLIITFVDVVKDQDINDQDEDLIMRIMRIVKIVKDCEDYEVDNNDDADVFTFSQALWVLR